MLKRTEQFLPSWFDLIENYIIHNICGKVRKKSYHNIEYS